MQEFILPLLISGVLFLWTFIGQMVYLDIQDITLLHNIRNHGFKWAVNNRPSAFRKMVISMIVSAAGPFMYAYKRRVDNEQRRRS